MVPGPPRGRQIQLRGASGIKEGRQTLIRLLTTKLNCGAEEIITTKGA
jgi:hypothetical protein